MSFIPGGYESDESDDYDCDNLVYVNDTLKNTTSNESFVTSKTHESNKYEPWGEEPRKAFLWPPKPAERSRSPSPARTIVLDDIRMAVVSGNLNALKKRVEEEGFFVDTVLHSGWTPLMYAANKAQPEVVQYLLDNNANPNYQTKEDNSTPLLVACNSSETDEPKLLECISNLLRCGAQCNTQDKHLNTPLTLAVRKRKQMLVNKLIDTGADLNIQDKEGWTPLHFAVNSGCGPLVKTLIERGANLDITSRKGQTAAELALEKDYKEIGDVIERVKRDNQRKFSDAEIESLQTISKPSSRLDTSLLPDSQKRFVDELDTFLSNLQLSEYKQTFIDQKITFRELLTLSEEDLDKIGIDKLGVRKKIIAKLTEVHKSKWKRDSLANLKTLDTISCPDAVAMMANIAKHLAYIEATIGYLRHQINKEPRILEYGQEAGNVQHLISENKQCLLFSQKIFDEVKYFTKDLDKVKNNAELNKGDVIDKSIVNYNGKAPWTQTVILTPVIILGSVIGVFMLLKHKML
ncbi:ankyrin repeat: SAM and basic leucine zipper domain-containing protein 1-like protein [Leptotrombidium deliense]|uniref:Ankyrin repeat: SAM and basic leucine zipper domain-containing protein 1-like protein n=1 Tax=Leptotrombidium deliense TaxID=299467 RepID=A0A443STH6_9ACAR|nr:ankyrin repeat: SAM and basic leucine zipper domain-containing protein 1-like protein [Leptotrombidium deliense]